MEPTAPPTGRPRRNAHCSFCGVAFAPDQPWPRHCAACGQTTYRNPIPVSVVLVPVDGGLLVVQRAVPPQVSRLALPGGYVGFGETWQEAGAREVREETGLVLDPARIADFRVRSAPDGTILIFGLAAPLAAADLPPFAPTAETSARLVLAAPAELAFPLHTDAAAAYFAAHLPGSAPA